MRMLPRGTDPMIHSFYLHPEQNLTAPSFTQPWMGICVYVSGFWLSLFLLLWYLRAKQWKKIHFFFYKDKLFFLRPRSVSGALCGQELCSVASSSHRERAGRLHTDESSEAAEGREEPRQPPQGSVALAAGQAQAVEC